MGSFTGCAPKGDQEVPNILWISCEDITTMLGCYGDPNAHTPNLDAFAERSALFTHAFATAPVCSPSRSCIITGVYATTLGTQHLRSHHEIPESILPFPKYLREAGYFVTNNEKEDYNFTDSTVWDISSKAAHWRQRSGDQPFFSVFNFTLTHQSSIFGNDSVYHNRVKKFMPFVKQTHPDTVQLLPYYPDTPEVRKLWARYYTNVSIIDYQFGQVMEELEKDGLADNTIVFFFSDHGTGMPRSKRAVYDSGLKIPLLVHIPEKYEDRYDLQMGTKDDRIVSFVDFAPTILSIAGIPVPEQMQGSSFLEMDYSKDYAFGASDRVDEGYELARSIRSKNYRYIRNFLPHLPLLQPNFYTDQSEIMTALKDAERNQPLTEDQLTLFRPARTPEELYDIEKDPNELNNLALDPNYSTALLKMRSDLTAKMIETHDAGLIPEPEMIRLSKGRNSYDLSHSGQVPFDAIMQICDLMLLDEIPKGRLMAGLHHENGLVRYWSLIALKNSELEDQEITFRLRSMLSDDFPTVQMEAASLLFERGFEDEALPVIFNHFGSEDYIALYAARTYQLISNKLDKIPVEVKEAFEKLDQETNYGKDWSQYYKIYTYWSLSEASKTFR